AAGPFDAPTTRATKAECAGATSRRALSARLSPSELALPPRRERREAPALLAAPFIARHDRGGVPRTLSRDAARALFAYGWPHNIRELEQVLSSALAVAEGEIGIEHLRPPVRAAGPASALSRLID